MTELTPEKRAELRECVSQESNLEAVYWPIGGVTLLALLDAADERDALTAVAREADQMHAVMLAAEGELLGDSPELPRWERLLLNGLTLPELAKGAADERDRLQGLIDEVGARVQWSAESGVTLLEYLDQLCEEAGKAVVAVERVRALAYASDDGTRYGHDGHSPIYGYPECPGCWADDILAMLGGADDELNKETK